MKKKTKSLKQIKRELGKTIRGLDLLSKRVLGVS